MPVSPVQRRQEKVRCVAYKCMLAFYFDLIDSQRENLHGNVKATREYQKRQDWICAGSFVLKTFLILWLKCFFSKPTYKMQSHNNNHPHWSVHNFTSTALAATNDTSFWSYWSCSQEAVCVFAVATMWDLLFLPHSWTVVQVSLLHLQAKTDPHTKVSAEWQKKFESVCNCMQLCVIQLTAHNCIFIFSCNLISQCTCIVAQFK